MTYTDKRGYLTGSLEEKEYELKLNRTKKTLRDLRYRAYVGPVDKFDLISANQFSLLVDLGLRDTHYLLDIGCGSLGGGRLFIPYLLPNRYHGIEPVNWLIQEGIRNELGSDIIHTKKPVFDYNREFNLKVFNKKFDYILAQSIFSHASESQIRKCVSAARSVIRPSSKFVVNFLRMQCAFSLETLIIAS